METREQRLAGIRERESKATKGPWKREGPKNGWGNNIAVCPTDDKEPAIYHSFAHPESVIDDADFIAHARADIPYLLSALDSESERVLLECINKVCILCRNGDVPQRSESGGYYHRTKHHTDYCVAAAIHDLRSKGDGR